MRPLPARVRRSVLLRSFLVQGSWNYETLIGTGFAFVLLPALRYLHRSDPRALRAAAAHHAELFNSHPYLATLAAGAVARLEAEGAAPEVIDRFKAAVRGSLGSMGDQLIWLAWRPAVALLAIVLLVMGTPWWIAVLAFLLIYNSLHLWLRGWGLELGLREGLAVASSLREAPLGGWSRRAADGGTILTGIALVMVGWQAGPSAWGIGAAVAGALVGLWFGLRVRRPVFAALLVLWIVGIASGLTR